MRTILVVDDEQEVLTFVQSALHRFGFDALLAPGGDVALQLFEKHSSAIDMLLTDVVMPGISGPMLVDRILAIQPSLPVLFMSGYDDRQIVQRYVLKEGFALLAKPFTLEALGIKIQELLPAAPLNSKSQKA